MDSRLSGVISTMSLGTLLALRLIHVVVGVFWVGSVTFITLFLVPTIRDAGPAGGVIMQQLTQVRRMPIWLMAASILTLLSGITLYWHDSAGFSSSSWLASGTARLFGLGGLLAIVATVVGMGVNLPAARRLGALAARLQAAGRAPTPEEGAVMQGLQRRLAVAGMLAMVLLLLAAAAMATARYV
jgi:uncharacterized membrane protein